MLLLKILLIILLILFPFGEIFRFNIGNNIFLKPLDAISILFLIWTAILYVKNKPFRQSLKWHYFYFPIIGFVSLLFNSYWLKPNEFLASFLYLLRWVSYLSIFFAVIQMEEVFKKRICKILVVDGLLVVLIGYIQYFLYPSLRNLYYMGWDEHLYRMFSSFLDPNFAGAFFVLYFIFILGLLFGKMKTHIGRTKFFYGSIAVLTVLAIFLTYSRSALLMFFISGAIFFLLLQKRRFILYLIFAIVLFIIIISPFFYIENLDLFRVTSSIERLDTAQNAIKIILDHPIIGVGFDTYRYAQIHYHLIRTTSQFPANSASGEDTSLLFVFATTGILGLFAYCYLWFKLFTKAFNSFKTDKFALIFFASGVGLFIDSLFVNSLFYAEIMLWIWVITGLMLE